MDEAAVDDDRDCVADVCLRRYLDVRGHPLSASSRPLALAAREFARERESTRSQSEQARPREKARSGPRRWATTAAPQILDRGSQNPVAPSLSGGYHGHSRAGVAAGTGPPRGVAAGHPLDRAAPHLASDTIRPARSR